MDKKRHTTRIKQFFITMPRSEGITKLDFYRTLSRYQMSYCKIVEEKHKDGSPHLHALVVFENTYTKNFILNYLQKEYPDYSKRVDVDGARSLKNSDVYLNKDDTNALIVGALPDPARDLRITTKRKAVRKHYLKFLEVGFDPIAGQNFDEWFDENIEPKI